MNTGIYRCALVVLVGCLSAAAWAGEGVGPTTAQRFARGMELYKTADQEIAARTVLSDVYFSSDASADQRAKALKALNDLAHKTIFSSKVYEGDEVAYAYTVRAKDTLASLSNQSGCPVAILKQINGLSSDSLKAGSTIKLLRGPFHVQIDKSACTLTVYANPGNSGQTFLYQARVAVGRNNGTPEGLFRIGAKAEKATWNPPSSMKDTNPNPVKWGQKGYPLGKDGIFMRLTGIDPQTSKMKGYGIHSTNDQGSIGKARSHGCVRVGDKDIRNLYNMLEAGASEVRILP